MLPKPSIPLKHFVRICLFCLHKHAQRCTNTNDFRQILDRTYGFPTSHRLICYVLSKEFVSYCTMKIGCSWMGSCIMYNITKWKSKVNFLQKPFITAASVCMMRTPWAIYQTNKCDCYCTNMNQASVRGVEHFDFTQDLITYRTTLD